MALNILEYHDRTGRSPFRDWFNGLNSDAARKVTTTLYRLGLGNVANVKGVGTGVYESRINFGPRVLWQRWRGTRDPFGRRDEEKTADDIQAAIRRWQDYKQRKKEQRERS